MSTIDKIVSEQTQLNSYIEPEEDVGVYPQWAKLMDASDSEKINSWSNYPGFESLHNDDGRFFCTAKSFEEIIDSNERAKLMQHWLVIAQRRQAYEDHYKKLQDETFGFLTSELNPTTQERKEMIDFAHVVFDATTHPCGLCNVEQVKYQQYSQDRCAQTIGGTFMACQTCLKQSVWTVQDALTLWGFTEKQLSNIPFWRDSTLKKYSTETLSSYRKQYPMEKSQEMEIINEATWKRAQFLPEFIRQNFVEITVSAEVDHSTEMKKQAEQLAVTTRSTTSADSSPSDVSAGALTWSFDTASKAKVIAQQDATLGVAVSVDIPKQTYVARYKKAICPTPKA